MSNNSTLLEISTLAGRLKTMNAATSQQDVFELVTRTKALFTDYDKDAFIQVLDIALERYLAKCGAAANCKVTLRDSMLGILTAFREHYEAGFIIETGIRSA